MQPQFEPVFSVLNKLEISQETATWLERPIADPPLTFLPHKLGNLEPPAYRL